jgi:hypothetical protein
MGFAEAPGVNLSASMALRSQVSFLPPSGLADRAYFGFKWASGDSGGLDSFLPIKGLNAGTVFNANLSGIFALGGGYFTRRRTCSLRAFNFDIFASGRSAYDAELDFENVRYLSSVRNCTARSFFSRVPSYYLPWEPAHFSRLRSICLWCRDSALLAASLVVSF